MQQYRFCLTLPRQRYQASPIGWWKPWMDDGRGRVFFHTPGAFFFLEPQKIIKNPEVMFWNFQISWKTQPNQHKKGWFIMVWPRNFDEFWVEIFGEGDSRKELREINPKDAGKKNAWREAVLCLMRKCLHEGWSSVNLYHCCWTCFITNQNP